MPVPAPTPSTHLHAAPASPGSATRFPQTLPALCRGIWGSRVPPQGLQHNLQGRAGEGRGREGLAGRGPAGRDAAIAPTLGTAGRLRLSSGCRCPLTLSRCSGFGPRSQHRRPPAAPRTEPTALPAHGLWGASATTYSISSLFPCIPTGNGTPRSSLALPGAR